LLPERHQDKESSASVLSSVMAVVSKVPGRQCDAWLSHTHLEVGVKHPRVVA
jgi:hypothetical protein